MNWRQSKATLFEIIYFIYVIAIIGYFGSCFLGFMQHNANLSFIVFNYWFLLKPLLLLILMLDLSNPIDGIIWLVFLYVMIMLTFVGSLGQMIQCLQDLIDCNSSSFFNNPCNDVLYCCVYWQEYPNFCINHADCPLVVARSQLNTNKNFIAFIIFVFIFVILEVIILGIFFSNSTNDIDDTVYDPVIKSNIERRIQSSYNKVVRIANNLIRRPIKNF